MTKVEEYYDCHENPYHNSVHGADVAQTLNSLIVNTGIIVSEIWRRSRAFFSA